MRPLVISHAACAGHAPENTLAAFERGIAEKADAGYDLGGDSRDGIFITGHSCRDYSKDGSAETYQDICTQAGWFVL